MVYYSKCVLCLEIDRNIICGGINDTAIRNLFILSLISDVILSTHIPGSIFIHSSAACDSALFYNARCHSDRLRFPTVVCY